MAVSDLDQTIEQYQLSLNQLLKGDPDPSLNFFSRSDEVSLANPFSPTVCGWKAVEEELRTAGAILHDGGIDRFEPVTKMVTPAMAFCVWIEHTHARFGDRETIDSFALRVTVIFRLEDAGWKLVHRHADSVTEARPIAPPTGN